MAGADVDHSDAVDCSHPAAQRLHGRLAASGAMGTDRALLAVFEYSVLRDDHQRDPVLGCTGQPQSGR
ncbi:hypothetical protein D3C71_2186250 [compost metagenome]